MKIFDLFKRNKSKPQIKEEKPMDFNIHNSPPDESEIDMTLEVSEEEKEIVSLIASAIASGDHPDAKFKVISVKGIDTDKEMAAAIVSAMAAGDHPNSNFRLKSIREIK